MKHTFVHYLALLMLALFFLPYVWKLRQLDLTLVLLLGLALPLYELYRTRKAPQ